MARRTFANLRDEHIKRVGRVGDAAYSARAEELIKAAYFELATLYHHHELDAIDTSKTMSTGSNTVTAPTGAYVVMAVVLRAVSDGEPIKALRLNESRYQFALYAAGSGEPSSYTRFGSSLYTDKKADAAYPLTIYHYRLPTEPAFVSTTSELSVAWDEAILEQSIADAFTAALWRPDLGQAHQARLDRFLAGVPQLPLRVLTLPGQPETPTSGRPHGGPRG
jgi:hypothetical protein